MKLLRSSFGPESVVHSFHKCKSRSCSSVSSSEQDCLAKRLDDRYHHLWINETIMFCSRTGYNWLLYEEGQGMLCLLCRKHNINNTENKSKKFNMEPAVWFKKKAVEEHANSQQHSAAINAELLSRVPTFNEEIERKGKTRDDVYYNTFLVMYWLSKEEIANKNFGSLLELFEQVGLKNMRFFQHTSAGSVREMFLLLGKVVWDTVTNPFSDMRSFSLLCDKPIMLPIRSNLSHSLSL